MLISRSLGAEVGVGIGLLFAIANLFSVAFFAVGLAETLNIIFLEVSWSDGTHEKHTIAPCKHVNNEQMTNTYTHITHTFLMFTHANSTQADFSVFDDPLNDTRLYATIVCVVAISIVFVGFK